MAHNLEQQSNGDYSFVAAREPGWHHLGKVYPDQAGLTLDTILTDLNVGEIITDVVSAGNHGVTIPGQKMTIRRRPYIPQAGVSYPDGVITHADGTAYEYIPLGVVGEDYTVIGERTAFEFMQVVAHASGAIYETAGLLGSRGQRAFATLRFPDGVLIGGVDPIDLYLVVAFSHDGSLAYTGMATPIRVVCRNTLTWATQQAVRKWSIRHSKHAGKAMNAMKASKALDLSFAYFGAWADEAEQLIATTMTDLEFEEIIAELYDPDNKLGTGTTTKQAATVFAQQVSLLETLWEGPTVAGIKNTAWGALQALTEEIDWYRRTRDVDPEDKDGHMFERSLFGTDTSAVKERAAAAVKKFAGVK